MTHSLLFRAFKDVELHQIINNKLHSTLNHMVTNNQIINDYVDTANENDLVEDAEYFNHELLFDPVVEILKILNINSPDNGYSTE